MLGGKTLTTDYGEVVSYAIRRCEFDHFLLQRSGTQLRLGTALTNLQREAGLWQVNGEYATPLLIGAGGHFCAVARRLNPKAAQSEPVVAAQEVEFALSMEQQAACHIEADRPELYFLPELDGYGWCVRKGNYLNIGLGQLDNKGLGQRVSQFRQMLIDAGRIPADVPERFHGHAYRLYEHSAQRQIIDDGVLLIGDAAGLAYPQSGEGIRPAVESGLLAARTILDAQGDYRLQRLQSYPEQLELRFGKRTPHPDTPSDWLPQAFTRSIGAWLLGNPWFTRHTILDNWFLHRQVAPLPNLINTSA